MTIKAIFKSQLPSFSYHFKNGMTAVFIFGRYETDDVKLIQELSEEIGAVGVHKSKHPYIFIDENEYELDTEALTPMQLVMQKAKQEARAELLAEQAAERARAMNPAANVSNTQQSNFAESLGNSNTIADVTTTTSLAKPPSMLPVGVGPAEGTAEVDQTQFDPVVKEVLDAPVTPVAPAAVVADVVQTPPIQTSMGAKLANLSINKKV